VPKANHSSRGVLPGVVCLRVMPKLQQRGSQCPLGLSSCEKNYPCGFNVIHILCNRLIIQYVMQQTSQSIINNHLSHVLSISAVISSSNGLGLAHIIKKNRLWTRYFAAILRVVTAVQSGSVPPYSLVSKAPSSSLH